MEHADNEQWDRAVERVQKSLQGDPEHFPSNDDLDDLITILVRLTNLQKENERLLDKLLDKLQDKDEVEEIRSSLDNDGLDDELNETIEMLKRRKQLQGN